MKPRERIDGRPAQRGRGRGGFKEQAVGAALWMAGFRVAQQVLDNLFTLVLVRLLVPADFGLIAMAGVFTAVLNVVSDMGLARAVVQRRDVDQEYSSTAFWANLAMGILLGVIALAVSTPVARLYGEPGVRGVFAVLSLRFVFAGASATAVAMLWRGLGARTLVLRNTISIIAAGVVAIVLALRGAGVWALVAQSLTLFTLRSALLWVSTPWRPSLRFSWVKFKDMWGFGSRILGARIFRFAVVQSDNLLIGRTLGATLLGYYAFAYGMFLAPSIDISHIVAQVSFSTFSRLQEDRPKLRHAFLMVSQYVSLFALPALLGFLLIAHDLVTVAFGAKWLPAVPVLRILLAAALLQIHTALWTSIYSALDRTDWVFKWAFIAAALYVPAFVIGLRWGIQGVAAGYTLSTLILVPSQLGLVARLVDLRLRDYLRSLQPLVLACALMAGAVLLVQMLAARSGAAPLVRLAIAIPVGVVAYLLAVTVLKRELVAGVWATVMGQWRPRRSRLAEEAG